MTTRPGLVEALSGSEPLVMAELRPPRADLSDAETVDVWIDTYHAVGRLSRAGRYVLLTDNAVGAAEEENLAHLDANLSDQADPTHVVPFLTSKHSLEYCLLYAQRAKAQGFRAITVVGGDPGGIPRCLPHAHMLRRRIREHVPDLALGGWVNPHRDPGEQVDFLRESQAGTDFFLSQIVSHHSAQRVEALLREMTDRGVTLPGAFGVFYYRSSATPSLERLSRFFPVPVDALAREFEEGVPAEEICARTLRALRAAGAHHVYLSNLGLRGAAKTLDRILRLV